MRDRKSSSTSFAKKFFFFTKEQIPSRQLRGLEPYNANKRSGFVYTDHEIYEVAANQRAVINERSYYLPRWVRRALGDVS